MAACWFCRILLNADMTSSCPDSRAPILVVRALTVPASSRLVGGWVAGVLVGAFLGLPLGAGVFGAASGAGEWCRD